MPYINHHEDTKLTYLATPHIKDTIGCSSIEYNRKTHKLSDLRARRIGIQNEYIENVDTPIARKYNKLSYAVSPATRKSTVTVKEATRKSIS